MKKITLTEFKKEVMLWSDAHCAYEYLTIHDYIKDYYMMTAKFILANDEGTKMQACASRVASLINCRNIIDMGLDSTLFNKEGAEPTTGSIDRAIKFAKFNYAADLVSSEMGLYGISTQDSFYNYVEQQKDLDGGFYTSDEGHCRFMEFSEMSKIQLRAIMDTKLEKLGLMISSRNRMESDQEISLGFCRDIAYLMDSAGRIAKLIGDGNED
jgi:hypothetical protein